MKDDILQMPRDAYPAPHAISDNDAESRENTGAEIRGSATSPTSEASDLPDGLMNVPQGRGLPARIEGVGLQAHRATEDPRHKDRETAACQERRAGRDAPCHGQRHLIGLPMAARPLARDTCHIATTPGLDAPFCVPNCRLKEPAREHLFLIKLERGPVGPALTKPGGFPCALFLPDGKQNVKQRPIEDVDIYPHSHVARFQVMPSAKPVSTGSKSLLASSTDAPMLRSEWGRPV